MSVKFTHPDYDKMFNIWQRCIDVCEGQDAIHQGGQKYLPQLKDESDSDYKDRVDRTPFYNASQRTLVGLRGMLFRKTPQTVLPPAIEPMLKDVTMDGTSMLIFAQETVERILKTGRCGILVDFPVVDNKMTQADAKRLQLRPLLKRYTELSITNWQTTTVQNQTILSLVVLKETYTIEGEDEFENEEGVQYRVLDLDINPDTNKYMYRVRIYQIQMIDGKEVEVLIGEPTYPKVNDQNLEKIPFYFLGVNDTNSVVKMPPLIDLINMNVSHYRVTADYEHGCHFTGLPTPYITGHKTGENPEEKFYIGSHAAWTFGNENTKVAYLEFTGLGLKSLENNIAAKETKMAILGARMLEPQNSGVESADTVAIRRVGEQSILSSLGQNVSDGLTSVLKVFAAFANAASEDLMYRLNRDFYPIPLDALTLTAIVAAWQNQAISYETMFDNLQESSLIDNDQTAEKEQQAISANPPPLPPGKIPTTPGNQTSSAEVHAPKGAATPTTLAPTITQLQHTNT